MVRFSSWTELRKCVAWMLRYRSRLQQACCKRRSGEFVERLEKKLEPITVEEMELAEKEILKKVQWKSFAEEIQTLKSKEELNKSIDEGKKPNYIKKTSVIVKLDPVLKNGILCVGGRLKNASIPVSAKNPAIIPSGHRIVDLIVRHCHLVSGHSGLEYTLSLIREKFWIVKGRSAVKKVLRNCFSCRKRQSPVGEQKMSDLPADRVTPSKPPFTFTGVDCFGPFHVKRGRSLVKRYGVLFTCLNLRAIHIEVAHSMDTSSFVEALRRFIARRGSPEEIRSDNGGNFVAAEKELREAIEGWNQQTIHEALLQRNIKWVFNTPTASHHGGVWERCIRTVRKVLNAILQEQTLTDESLSTLMCEVESIVNGRPLTKVSDDPHDMEALTPNHLLLLRSGVKIPPGIFGREDLYCRRRWRQVQYLTDLFWRRWVKEYLPTIQQRQRWTRPRRNFAVGDLVLIVDQTVPRNQWLLGRIVEVYPGEDGYVRSVTVKTRSSMLKRPIDKLVLLENVAAYEAE